MTKRELEQILKNGYNRTAWKGLVSTLFRNKEFIQEDVLITVPTSSDIVENFYRLGTAKPDEFSEIGLYEVILKPGKVNLASNRVALRNLVKNEITPGLTDAALIVFNEPTTDKWRLSLLAKEWDSEAGRIIESTNRKRYTYILGEGESCKTAIDNFYPLIQKTGNASFKDLKDAFSVEKVSNDFFKEYKDQYQNFVQYITGKRFVKEKGKWKEKKVHEPHAFFASMFNGNAKDARDFCKKLLGRIVFLSFVQKKNWLGSSTLEYKDGKINFIRLLFEQSGSNETFYPVWLSQLFFDTLNNDQRNEEDFEMPDGSVLKVPFLNGGLFEMDRIDRRARLITFPASQFSNPDPVLKETPLKRGFLDFLDAFNFTVYEDSLDDHTVAVDPEMLGEIFENLLEDNKEKGAYYTPKEVVHFMCQESLIEYLLNKLKPPADQTAVKRTAITNFIKKQEGAGINDLEQDILRFLKEVKVCDPAIGSGAFPMGILQEIFQAVEFINGLNPDATKSIWELGQEWNAAKVKSSIIENSIYGVDIERGAVDIARLRFWLSLIVDEISPQPLPNLDYKIIAGDSLLGRFEGHVIEIDWNLKATTEREKEISDICKQISKEQKSFFQPTVDKPKIQKNIRNLKIDLLKAQLVMNKAKLELDLPTISLFEISNKDQIRLNRIQKQVREIDFILLRLDKVQKSNDGILDYFDWQLDFPEILNPHIAESRGFDIVIANPPYMRVQEIQKSMPDIKPFLETKYKEVAQGAYDLANLFFFLAVELSKETCSNSFIFPHKFFNSDSGTSFRDYLMKGKYVDKIAHFGANMVFNDADTYTCVTFFSKHANEGFEIQKIDFKADFMRLMHESSLYNFIPYKNLAEASFLYGGNQWILFGQPEEYKIFKKLNESKVNFKDIFEDIFQGIATSDDDLYILDSYEQSETTLKGTFGFSEDEYTVETKFFKPILKGKDVQRYCHLSTDLYVFFPYIISGNDARVVTLEELRVSYPLTYNYVISNQEAFKKRESGKAGRMPNYHAYIYPKNLVKFQQPKLSSMEICSANPNVTLNNNNFYHTTTVYSWVKKQSTTESYELFLAIANSNLMWWFLKNTGDTLQGDARRMKSNYLNPFPLPLTVRAETDSLIKGKVETIMQNKAQALNTKFLEKELDIIVYKLYNLSFEEAKIIEPKLEITVSEYDAVLLS